ncbi:hypothetical protein R4172_19300 [Rhodococcus kroppenstedtii]|uniref:hypothetical protein n=2 Tax=Rhodococcoides kroppenstedtii TaxID=293050 RepID=UPI0029538483|nr:hypothetical protein [Rhodococcus kroppenstedtii]MDV7199691.1 hypothetical protein [Rhodococcus kroppenstedtii]
MTERHEAVAAPPRSMTLHIPVFMIVDGTFATPVVGDVLTGPISFRETDPTDPDAETIRAHLTPTDEDPRVWSPPPGMPRRLWSGVLRGDGWTSGWTGATPRTGQVQISGHFHGGFTYAAHGTVRGRITRARIVTERHRQSSDGQWVVVPGFRSVREVARADVVDHRDRARHAGVEHVDMDSEVIVDLDLDDVPPLPLRPSIVPGAVSAAAGRTWIVDTELPLLVAISGDDAVTEYLLPGRIGMPRSIWAVPDGCWAAGEDGTYWTPVDGESVQVDDRGIHAGAVNGDTLLGCTGDSIWRLYRPGSEPVDLDITPAAGHVFSVVPHENGFVAVVKQYTRGDRGTRLVRVSRSGEVKVGPNLTASPAEERRYRWQRDFFLAGDPLRLVSHVDIGVIEPDLTVSDDGERLGQRQFAGGTVGEFGWSLGFLASGTPTPDEVWPRPNRETFDRATRMLRPPRKVLTLYDPRTMAPLTSVPMLGPTPSVTVDDAGTILVVARGGLAAFPASIPVMTWPAIIDVAALLGAARAQKQSQDENESPVEAPGRTPPDTTGRQQ